MKTQSSITVIMPICNGSITLPRVFEALNLQQDHELINKIIIINDCSTDNSAQIIREFEKRSVYDTEVITHTQSLGLAGTYNEGILLVRSDYFILMHQDIVLPDSRSFSKILEPFIAPNSEKIAVSFAILLHPREVWRSYNFWQKCLFSRFVGKRLINPSGKFDCYKTKAQRSIGLFNSEIYRTAGEDSDMKNRLTTAGHSLVPADVEVIHYQENDRNFGLKKLIKKEAQLAESRGVILRHYGITNIKNFALNFFREGLFIMLFIPYINLIGAALVLAYGFAYTGKLMTEVRDWRVFILPIINIALLPFNLFFSAKAFIRGTQLI